MRIAKHGQRLTMFSGRTWKLQHYQRRVMEGLALFAASNVRMMHASIQH
jgi:hypothetical protein